MKYMTSLWATTPVAEHTYTTTDAGDRASVVQSGTGQELLKSPEIRKAYLGE